MKRLLALLLLSGGCTLLTQAFQQSCGDGFLQRGEDCDDGNDLAGDGCSDSCLKELCGDGTLDSGEECDDSNTIGGDGCDSSCQRESSCGDGFVDPGEGCDDGNTIEGDGCGANCQDEALCGNSTINNGEECDNGADVVGDDCDPSCQRVPSCGDTFVDAPEQCDDGNFNSNDGCSNLCVFEICGDGIVNNNNEQCDDGNLTSGDNCSAACTNEVCDNGIPDLNETCFASQNINVGNTPARVLTVDLNGDGTDEFLGCVGTSLIIFTISAGVPVQGTPLVLPGAVGGCVGLTVGDYDNNGKLDAAAVYDSSEQLFVVNDLSGAQVVNVFSLTNGSGPINVVSLGVDNNPGDDLVVSLANIDAVQVFTNIVGNTATETPFSTTDNPFGLAAADFNGDTKDDLVSINTNSATATFLLGTGSTFNSANGISLESGCFFGHAGDVDGDNDPDLLASCPVTTDTVVIALNNGAGGFGAALSLPTGLTNGTDFALLDLDNDDDLDLALVNQVEVGVVKFFLNNGVGVFTSASLPLSPAGDTPTSIAAGDFNGDGVSDLVVANIASSFITLLLSDP